jgi:hypothetical protein
MAKNKYTDIDLTKYEKGYQASDSVKLAEQQKTNAEKAVANYGDFSYKNQGAYDTTMNTLLNRGQFQYSNQDAYQQAMNNLLNRDKFSYDLNGDALYQQYKDNYITQGKMAMMDTMGQASAMTGGYGNSYAATVGNQAYQGYLKGLNDIVPELYQMALDRYNSEGDRLAQNYGVLSADREVERGEYNDETSRLAANFDVLSSDRNAEYGLWSDKRNQLVTDRGYYSDAYNNAYTQDYTAWNDNRTYDTSQYWNEYNAGYQAAQDAIANQLARDQIAATYAKANSGSSFDLEAAVKGAIAAEEKGDDYLYDYLTNNSFPKEYWDAIINNAGIKANFIDEYETKKKQNSVYDNLYFRGLLPSSVLK